MTAVAVQAVPPEHRGAGSGLLNTARQTGGAVGVAVLGGLLGSAPAPSVHVALAVVAAPFLAAGVLAVLATAGPVGGRDR